MCLSRHHRSPIELVLSDCGNENLGEVNWLAPDDRTEAAWANYIDATEAGAYACVIAGVEVMRQVFAVRRAETGTGADYYVGPAGAGVEDLEDCVRLEISGVGAGSSSDLRLRLLRKIRQAQDGESSLPALAGVFGFAAKVLMMQDVE